MVPFAEAEIEVRCSGSFSSTKMPVLLGEAQVSSVTAMMYDWSG